MQQNNNIQTNTQQISQRLSLKNQQLNELTNCKNMIQEIAENLGLQQKSEDDIYKYHSQDIIDFNFAHRESNGENTFSFYYQPRYGQHHWPNDYCLTSQDIKYLHEFSKIIKIHNDLKKGGLLTKNIKQFLFNVIAKKRRDNENDTPQLNAFTEKYIVSKEKSEYLIKARLISVLMLAAVLSITIGAVLVPSLLYALVTVAAITVSLGTTLAVTYGNTEVEGNLNKLDNPKNIFHLSDDVKDKVINELYDKNGKNEKQIKIQKKVLEKLESNTFIKGILDKDINQENSKSFIKEILKNKNINQEKNQRKNSFRSNQYSQELSVNNEKNEPNSLSSF